MNPEIVREELDDLERQIKETAEALRLLKKQRKSLENFLNPKQRTQRAKEA